MEIVGITNYNNSSTEHHRSNILQLPLRGVQHYSCSETWWENWEMLWQFWMRDVQLFNGCSLHHMHLKIYICLAIWTVSNTMRTCIAAQRSTHNHHSNTNNSSSNDSRYKSIWYRNKDKRRQPSFISSTLLQFPQFQVGRSSTTLHTQQGKTKTSP